MGNSLSAYNVHRMDKIGQMKNLLSANMYIEWVIYAI
jgi:hypothetical protein